MFFTIGLILFVAGFIAQRTSSTWYTVDAGPQEKAGYVVGALGIGTMLGSVLWLCWTVMP